MRNLLYQFYGYTRRNLKHCKNVNFYKTRQNVNVGSQPPTPADAETPCGTPMNWSSSPQDINRASSPLSATKDVTDLESLEISSINSEDTVAESVSHFRDILTGPEPWSVRQKIAEDTSSICSNSMSQVVLTWSDTSCEENSKELPKQNTSLRGRQSQSRKSSERSSSRETLSSQRSTRQQDRQQRPWLQTAPKKPSIKESFQNLLSKLNIKNSKHYDIELAKNPQLRKLENMMAPSSIEPVKKNMFNQNMYVPTPSYLERIATNFDDVKETLQFQVVEKAYQKIIENIANENGTTFVKVVKTIVEVMELLDSKVSTLVFIGESNSGKTVLSKVLRAGYYSYECGIIQSCPGRHPSDFWLQDCTGKSIYVCEELYINTLEICQRFKAIMEGNETLDTNVKYGGNKHLPRRPFIVTMNGRNNYDLAGDFIDEYKALSNRCSVFLMRMHTDGTTEVHVG